MLKELWNALVDVLSIMRKNVPFSKGKKTYPTFKTILLPFLNGKKSLILRLGPHIPKYPKIMEVLICLVLVEFPTYQLTFFTGICLRRVSRSYQMECLLNWNICELCRWKEMYHSTILHSNVFCEWNSLFKRTQWIQICKELIIILHSRI